MSIYMKKIILFITIILLLLGAISSVFAENATESLPNSAAYILIESSTGQVLSEYNADEQLSPASLTKIMLLLLIADEVNAGRLSLDESVVASVYASKKDGSVIWLEAGEIMSVGELVKAVIIASANDATVALAEHIAGSEEKFVKLMEQKAYVLGMRNTAFTNPVGYDNPEHYTTARDVAIMSRALMRDENYSIFAEYMLTRLSSVRTGTDRETQLLNTNKLITFYKGIEGIKTGTTDNAGYCLSAAAVKADMRLISVVMGCNSEQERVDLSEKLLDYGFANYQLCFPDSGLEFENLPLSGGVERDLKIIQMQTEAIVVPKGRAGDIKYQVYLPKKVDAPIARNQPVGTITAVLDNEVIYESYITAAGTAHKLTFTRVLVSLVKDFLGFS